MTNKPPRIPGDRTIALLRFMALAAAALGVLTLLADISHGRDAAVVADLGWFPWAVGIWWAGQVLALLQHIATKLPDQPKP